MFLFQRHFFLPEQHITLDKKYGKVTHRGVCSVGINREMHFKGASLMTKKYWSSISHTLFVISKLKQMTYFVEMK